MSLSSGFESKWPEHCVYHLWPHSNATEGEFWRPELHLVFVFNDTILVMSASSAKSNLLGLLIDLVKKTFMSKRTIISVIVLNSAICLCHDLFKSLDS